MLEGKVPGVLEAGKRTSFLMLLELTPIPAFARWLQVSHVLTPSAPQVAGGSSVLPKNTTPMEATLFRAQVFKQTCFHSQLLLL